MNDIARALSTVAIWLALGAILVTLTLSGSEDVTAVAFFLVIGAIASMGIVWGTAGKQAEARARAKQKRSESLAEERLDEQDIATLAELLEERRASRRLQDS